MFKKHRILITGCEGFIGSTLKHALIENGYDVWGIDVSDKSGNQVIAADLLDVIAAQQAVEACLPFSILIHTAALAHGQDMASGDSYVRINTQMTDNLLKAIEGQDPRLIFLSSVAVYGEDQRSTPVSTNDEVRPATDYGRSKLQCEKLVIESNVKNCDILRLAPVYDETHMKDVKKRVYLPGPLKIKLRFWPSPLYSLCNIETVVQSVLNLLNQPPCGHVIRNVADPRPYSQNELLTRFPGISLPLPTFIFKPFYYATYLLPNRIGYPCRCTYWKLFGSNVYQT